MINNIKLNDIYHLDIFEGLNKLPNNHVDLIICDPPYGTTDHSWDKFESENDYIDFIANLLIEFERVLKNTGSLYIFHNDFLKLVEMQNTINNLTNFKFRQLIVWNKRFEGCEFEDKKNATLYKDLRNYMKYAEYVLFLTFDEISDLQLFTEDKNNFSEYKEYIQNLLYKNNMTYNTEKIVRALYENLGYKSMQSARSISQRLFNMSYKAFGMLLEKHYDALKNVLKFDLTYKEIKALYDKGKSEYKNTNYNKYTYNNLKTHHSVWNYNNVKSKNMIHPTEKPIELIENIILHSSNENDTVLIPFVGSGVDCEASIKNNRNFIGFELDQKYVSSAKNRINNLFVNN